MEFEIYKTSATSADISPLSITREWMDNTFDRHAYHCFPVSLANGLGWGISYPKDIRIIWDGISDSTDVHIKILNGKEYVHTGRANASISFKTGFVLKTNKDLTMMTMPTPNWPIKGLWPFTTLVSTSFLKAEFPLAALVTIPNEEIIIPANTPVASIMPISLSNLNNSVGKIKKTSELSKDFFPSSEYVNKMVEIQKEGKWSDFYRNAVDHNGKNLGEHEVKSLRLRIDKYETEGPEQCGNK